MLLGTFEVDLVAEMFSWGKTLSFLFDLDHFTLLDLDF